MDFVRAAHALLAKHADELSVGVLAGNDVQAKIGSALERTGVRARRTSPLAPRLVCWLVLGLPLFRPLSVPNVFARLMDAWRRRIPGLPLRPVSDGALAHARARLGAAPMQALFEDLATEVEPAPSFHGLRVWAIDGTTLTVADTPANEAAFGRPVASCGRSAFPQLRLLTLSSCVTRAVRAARWCPFAKSEVAAAAPLVRKMGPGDLLLLDRGLGSLRTARGLERQGAAYLCRVRGIKPRWAMARAPGDFDVLIPFRRRTGPRRFTLVARLIAYRLPGGEQVRLITNLHDRRIPARAFVRLYHERWECELGFDEIKTHLAGTASGTLDTPLRGRSGPLVEQELWATLVTYNLVRRLLARAGDVHGIDPRRISFVDAIEVVRLSLPATEAAGPAGLLRLHVRLVGDLADCVLDRWRRPRVCPRALRQKTRPYRHKQPGERCLPYDFLAGLTFGAP